MVLVDKIKQKPKASVFACWTLIDAKLNKINEFLVKTSLNIAFNCDLFMFDKNT
jgi:hypothetical protein